MRRRSRAQACGVKGFRASGDRRGSQLRLRSAELPEAPAPPV